MRNEIRNGLEVILERRELMNKKRCDVCGAMLDLNKIKHT